MSSPKLHRLIRGWIRAQKVNLLWISVPFDLNLDLRTGSFCASAVQLCCALDIPVAIDGLCRNPCWQLSSVRALVRCPGVSTLYSDAKAYRHGAQLPFQVCGNISNLDRLGMCVQHGGAPSANVVNRPWVLPFELCRRIVRIVKSNLMWQAGGIYAKYFVPETD